MDGEGPLLFGRDSRGRVMVHVLKTSPGPMKRYIVKILIGSAISELLRYKLTHILLLSYKDLNQKFIALNWWSKFQSILSKNFDDFKIFLSQGDQIQLIKQITKRTGICQWKIIKSLSKTLIEEWLIYLYSFATQVRFWSKWENEKKNIRNLELIFREVSKKTSEVVRELPKYWKPTENHYVNPLAKNFWSFSKKASEVSKTRLQKEKQTTSEIHQKRNFRSCSASGLEVPFGSSGGPPWKSGLEALDSGFCPGGSQNELILDSGLGPIRSPGFCPGGPQRSSGLEAQDVLACWQKAALVNYCDDASWITASN